MRHLVVFDLDGTLLQTLPVDHEWFVEAIRVECGLDELVLDWPNYRTTTDSGLVPEILAGVLKREPHESEVDRVKRRFLSYLDAARVNEPHRFAPTVGAFELLERLRSDPRWTTAIATGAWAGSAEIKFRASGMDVTGIPLATADDHAVREEIVQHAIDRAGGARDARGVLVGDGVWDVEAARAHRLGFVGVATGRRADELKAAGAQVVLQHFEPVEEALEILATAPPPAEPTEG